MGLNTPAIVLNVKAYKESMGQEGLALARACSEVAEESGVSVAICPQQTELAWIANQVAVPCLAQHVDSYEPGSRTGWTVIDSIAEAGAIGSLVNHSEHRLLMADIENIVARMRELDLVSIVCTNNTAVSRGAATFEPTMVAIEPPDLIGSGIPVSKANPDIVTSSVEAVKEVAKNVKVLCGAGISTGEDVKAAIELGTDGVLLASGVVKASDPKKALLDLVLGI